MGATIEKLILKNVDIEGKHVTGGIIGHSYKTTISQVAVSGLIKGLEAVGGICGEAEKGTITESFTEAEVMGETALGGIAGLVYGQSVKNCYSNSTITSKYLEAVGGIIGVNDGGSILINNYFTGDFIGEIFKDFVGGIFGAGDFLEQDLGIVWDGEKSNLMSNFGEAEPKTTAEMKNINTFIDAGWDFVGKGDDEIWDIDGNRNNGYPFLAWAQKFIKDDTSVKLVHKIKTNKSVTMHLNPFSDVVIITGEGINRVKLYTISGVQLLNSIYNNESKVEIPKSQFKQGINLFVIENMESTETRKLIIR